MGGILSNDDESLKTHILFPSTCVFGFSWSRMYKVYSLLLLAWGSPASRVLCPQCPWVLSPVPMPCRAGVPQGPLQRFELCLRGVTLTWPPQEWSHCWVCPAHTSAAFTWAELQPLRGELSLILSCELLTPGTWWKLIKVSLWLTVGCLANPTNDYFQRPLLHCRIS